MSNASKIWHKPDFDAHPYVRYIDHRFRLNGRRLHHLLPLGMAFAKCNECQAQVHADLTAVGRDPSSLRVCMQCLGLDPKNGVIRALDKIERVA